MAASSTIPKSLQILRRRIRRVQWMRGGVRLATMVLFGLAVLIMADLVLAPLSQLIRFILFVAWLAAIAWTVFRFLIKPLGKSVSDLQISRWLERRHPELEERISTSLELGDKDSELLAALSKEAANDLDQIDPKVEVSTFPFRKWTYALLAGLGLIAVLVVVFPQQMPRLLARALSPFSKSGNAEAYLFKFDPGGLEVLAGDAIELKFKFGGPGELQLHTLTESGSELVETLLNQGDEISYQLPEAVESFDYFLRAGSAESDRHAVTVYPRPTLKNASVRYRYPAYTGWPERVTDLSSGVQAVSGTEVIVKSRLSLGVKEAFVTLDDTVVEEVEFSPDYYGGDLQISVKLDVPGVQKAVVKVNHRIGRGIELPSFGIETEEDAAPLVELIAPRERELRLRPDDQLNLVSLITEEIGITKVEIEVENKNRESSLFPALLPQRIADELPHQWKGETIVYLQELVAHEKKSREIKLRLKVSDNRPGEYGGPGVGYSEWLTIRWQKNAPSLARQELLAEQKDLLDSINKAIREARQAEQKMHQVKGQLRKEKLPQSAERKIAEARDQYAEIEKELEELAERMDDSVQAHRSDEVLAAAEKLSQASQNAEFTPLQDNEQSRLSEVEAAIRNSKDAVRSLEELRNEAQRDQQKIEDLARLEELAQKQASLARQAEEEKQSRDWQQEQERVKNEIRNRVQQSPEALAESLKRQAEKAETMAEEAHKQALSQDALAEAQKESATNEIREALKKAQAEITAEMKAELADARARNEARANTLPEAVAQAESAQEASSTEEAAAAAKAASDALSENEESSDSQKALREKQDQVAEGFEALAENHPAKALGMLEQIQAEAAAEFAVEMKNFETPKPSASLNQALNQSQHGANRADQAMKEQANNQRENAERFHQQSAEHFEDAAEKLSAASKQFAAESEKAAGQQARVDQAAAPGEPLAEAFEQSSTASSSSSSRETAQASRAAAEALQAAAQEARQAMSQNRQPRQSGQAEPAGESQGENSDSQQDGEGEGGQEPQEGVKPEQADPGVPPQIARLGVSAKDWEKIRATLKSEVSGSTSMVIPEDYRELVKEYFDQVTRAKK